MHLLVRTEEIFFSGPTVDTDEKGHGPAEVNDDPSVSGEGLFGTRG